MNDKFKVKGGASKQEFASGAVRDAADDKTRPDLISPFFTERLGEHLRKGAEKYSPWNWAKGIPNSRCLASLERHLIQFKQGDRSEDHLSAIVANAMFMIHNEEAEKKGAVLCETEEWQLVDVPVFRIIKKKK